MPEDKENVWFLKYNDTLPIRIFSSLQHLVEKNILQADETILPQLQKNFFNLTYKDVEVLWWFLKNNYETYRDNVTDTLPDSRSEFIESVMWLEKSCKRTILEAKEHLVNVLIKKEFTESDILSSNLKKVDFSKDTKKYLLSIDKNEWEKWQPMLWKIWQPMLWKIQDGENLKKVLDVMKNKEKFGKVITAMKKQPEILGSIILHRWIPLEKLGEMIDHMQCPQNFGEMLDVMEYTTYCHFWKMLSSSEHPENVGDMIDNLKTSTKINLLFYYYFDNQTKLARILDTKGNSKKVSYILNNFSDEEVRQLTDILSFGNYYCSDINYVISNQKNPKDIFSIDFYKKIGSVEEQLYCISLMNKELSSNER